MIKKYTEVLAKQTKTNKVEIKGTQTEDPYLPYDQGLYTMS